MEAARFRWFILISFIIHILLLSLFRFLPIHELKLFPPLEVGLITTPSSPQPETSIQPGRTGQPTTRTTPLRGSTRTKSSAALVKRDSLSSTRENPSPAEGTSTALGGTSSGTGPTAPGSEGIAIGSGGSPPGTGGASSGQTGPASSTKRGFPGTGGTSTGTKKGSGESEKDDFSGVEIPSYVIDAAGFRSRFDDGGIYPEIDSYVLHTGDKRIGIPVPGTEVCIEGDQLHTKERMMITETKTDHSKCHIVESGDRVPLKEICPPEAESRTVHFNHYASSPVEYSVKTCLEYDRSNCYIAGAGDDGEREVCRVDFRYEGIWAEGTIFDYKCTKSEARTYRHPLQYEIRWIMEVHIPGTDGDRHAKRQVHQETRTVEPCS
jgi:hypothetical protein